MKDELQQKLVEILTSIQTATGKASDFAMAQLPDIAQSYVAYGRVISLLQIAMCVAVVISVWRWTKWTYKQVDDGMDSIAWMPVAIFGTAAVVISGLTFFYSVQSAALAWLAPKVWLLKELSSLVK